MYYIYYLEDPTDYKKGYIGKTNNPAHRMYKHLWEKKNTPKCDWINSLLLKSLKPTMIILDRFELEDDSYAWEYNYIKRYKELGYNLKNYADGGKGVPGYTRSAEEIERQAAKLRGKKRLNYKRNPEYVMSQESRKKISDSKKGKPIQQHVRDALKKAATGRVQSQEEKDKRASKLKGFVHSKETVQKYIKAQCKIVDAGMHHTAKSVLQYDISGNIIKKWRSIKDIYLNLGYKRETIAKRCKDEKEYKGFIWKLENNK